MTMLYFASHFSLALCTDGDIKLFGSTVERAGIVLVCVNRTWGKVCGGGSDPHFASIVCAQLGYTPHGMAIILESNYYALLIIMAAHKP